MMETININEILEKSGWNEKRIVNINDTISFLQSEGYQINNIQIDFLKQYEGLEIKFNNPRLPSTIEKLKLNPREAASTIFRSLVEEYEEYCGTTFIIVGEIEQENMTIYMDEEGRFFGGYDDYLIELGDDFKKSLFNLVNGTELEINYIE